VNWGKIPIHGNIDKPFLRIKKPSRSWVFSCIRAVEKRVRLPGNLFAARDAEAFVEALNTTTGINNTLFAGVERVAFTAHVQVQIVTHGRAGFDHITARTGCSNFNILRMNTFFHGVTSVKAVSLSRARKNLHRHHTWIEHSGDF
jgi:hypothetical protein